MKLTNIAKFEIDWITNYFKSIASGEMIIKDFVKISKRDKDIINNLQQLLYINALSEQSFLNH